MRNDNDTYERTGSGVWLLPLAWCAVTAVIIAAGLTVPFDAGPQSAGFDYLFIAGGHDTDFTRSLGLYSLAAAGLGAAFMFIPKATTWRFRKGMAWTTFMLMVVGGVLMLIVPQLLRWLAIDGAASASAYWSVLWMEVGARISLAGGLVGLATLFDAWFHRG